MNGRIYPVDRLLAGYNLAMAVIWWVALPVWRWAVLLMAAHAMATGLPWLLRRATRLSRPVRQLRLLYPLAWLLVFWTEVDLVRRSLHSGAHDAFVLSLEQRLLGMHPDAIWMAHMHQLWFSEILYGSYLCYLLVLVIPALWLALHSRHDDLMATFFRMMVTFSVCFLLFALFPVDGPQHTGHVFDGPNQYGFFASLVTLVARGNGESLGAAFPSSHVAGAVTMAWIARLYLPRWAFYVLAAEAVGVFLSTFYTQQHYAIDAIAGALLALVIQGSVVPALLAARRQRLPIPGIPPLLPASAHLPVFEREVQP